MNRHARSGFRPHVPSSGLPRDCARLRRTPLAIAVTAALCPGLLHAVPGDPLGPEAVVNATTTGQQGSAPSGGANIASAPDGRHVVVWSGDGAGDTAGVFMHLFDAAGNTVVGETLVNTATAGVQQNPSVGMADDGRFVVAWDTDTVSVQARLFDAGGVPASAEIPVDSAITARNPDVAMDADGDFILAWERYGGPDSDIFFQRFDAAGTGIGAIAAIDSTPEEQLEPTVAIDPDGDAVIAWAETTGADPGIRYVRVASGSSTPSAALNAEVGAGVMLGPDVDMADNGDFTLVWSGEGPLDQSVDAPGVSMRRFQADGTPYDATGEVQVNATVIGLQTEADVAVDADGDTVVIWTGFAVDDLDVYFQRFASPGSGGAPAGAETLASAAISAGPPPATPPNNQFLPAVTADANGNYVAAWTDDGSAGGASPTGDGSQEAVVKRAFEGPSGAPPPPAPPPNPIDIIVEAQAQGKSLGPLALAVLALGALIARLRRRR